MAHILIKIANGYHDEVKNKLQILKWDHIDFQDDILLSLNLKMSEVVLWDFFRTVRLLARRFTETDRILNEISDEIYRKFRRNTLPLGDFSIRSLINLLLLSFLKPFQKN